VIPSIQIQVAEKVYPPHPMVLLEFPESQSQKESQKKESQSQSQTFQLSPYSNSPNSS
jgi:hypothetical protein